MNFLNGVPGNAESMAALRLVAHVANTVIVQIEQRHATLRRRLKVMGLEQIAFRSNRYRKLKCRQGHGKTARAEKPKARALCVKDKERGSGGTWRAFVTMGQKRLDFRSLGHNCRELEVHEFSEHLSLWLVK